MDMIGHLQFDGDGQHLPEYLTALSEEIDNGNDCVIGSFCNEEATK